MKAIQTYGKQFITPFEKNKIERRFSDEKIRNYQIVNQKKLFFYWQCRYYIAGY